jgi:hypothetical protein
MLAERIESSRQLLAHDRPHDRAVERSRDDDGQGSLPRLRAGEAGRIRGNELVDNYGDRMRQGIEASKAHWGKAGTEAMKAALAAGQAAEAQLAERFRCRTDAASAELDALMTAIARGSRACGGRDLPARALWPAWPTCTSRIPISDALRPARGTASPTG